MVSDEDNATIERMIEEGKTAIAIRAAVPDVSRTNVYLKIAKFKKHGTVRRVQTKTLGRPRVMSEGVDKFLQGLLTAKPDMELEEMRRHIQDQLQLTVSMSTISRAITRAGIANGRPNRARNPTRRKNRNTATAEPDEAADFSSVSAQPNDKDAANIVAPAQQAVWDQMQEDTSLTQHHHSSQMPHQLMHQHHQHAQDSTLMSAPLHHGQTQDLHVLDPSLAQSYPLATPYQNVYSELPRGGAPVSLGINAVLPGHMEVYRSPYAPL